MKQLKKMKNEKEHKLDIKAKRETKNKYKYKSFFRIIEKILLLILVIFIILIIYYLNVDIESTPIKNTKETIVIEEYSYLERKVFTISSTQNDVYENYIIYLHRRSICTRNN